MVNKVVRKILFLICLIFLATVLKADPKMILGLEVYNNKALCGSCHVLQSAKSVGQIGPNLDQLKPQISQIIYAVKNGIGVMPAFEGVLSKDEIDAVAYYVFSSTQE